MPYLSEKTIFRDQILNDLTCFSGEHFHNNNRVSACLNHKKIWQLLNITAGKQRHLYETTDQTISMTARSYIMFDQHFINPLISRKSGIQV